LHAACSIAAVNCVRVLLKYGAELNTRDKIQRTPLHWAAWYQYGYL